ncbi:MAG: VWA domain-containing protein [Defluviitaleaceae bacterium]|nr:VWA domain-containing protein [Defluviitaleaceae bacterium]
MKKLLFVVVLVFFCNNLAAGGVATSDVAASEVAARELVPIDAVLVLDVSRSMRTADPDGVARGAMNLFVEKLTPERDRVALVAYAGSVENQLELHTIGEMEMFGKFINEQALASWTDHGLGLVEAVGMLGGAFGNGAGEESETDGESEAETDEAEADNIRQGIIIFLTDGNMNVNPSGSRTNEAAQADVATAIYTAKELNVPIHTIGLNFDGNLATEYLADISQATRGLFFEAVSADGIPEIIDAFFYEMVAVPEIVDMQEPDPMQELDTSSTDSMQGVDTSLTDSMQGLDTSSTTSMQELDTLPTDFMQATDTFLSASTQEVDTPLSASMQEAESTPEHASEATAPYKETEITKKPDYVMGAVGLGLGGAVLLAGVFFRASGKKRVFTGQLEIYLPAEKVTSCHNLIEYGKRVTLSRLLEASEQTASRPQHSTPSEQTASRPQHRTATNTALSDIIFMPSPTAPSHLPRLQVKLKNPNVRFFKDFVECDISKEISLGMGTEASIEVGQIRVNLRYVA